MFISQRDCEDFENRLAVLTIAEEVRLFAYALMGNHFHLVVRREGERHLGHFMGRLLTGYVVSFNLRYNRVGHLFQNRYKSILCEEDAYLLQLVRYVHLNPLRAGIVEDPASYRWSSHRDYLSGSPRSWLDTEEVLDQLGGAQAYCRFIENGYDEGARPDLCGVVRRRGVVERRHAPRPRSPNLWFGGQVLGGQSFATRVSKRIEWNFEPTYESSEATGERLTGLAEDAAKGVWNQP